MKNKSGQFLHDSGLLFHINRTVFHPIGLCLTIDEEGNLGPIIEDINIQFNKETLHKASIRLKKFMKVSGQQRIQKRLKNFGWAVQRYGQDTNHS